MSSPSYTRPQPLEGETKEAYVQRRLPSYKLRYPAMKVSALIDILQKSYDEQILLLRGVRGQHILRFEKSTEGNPIPTPKPDEIEENFLSRCMSDSVMVREFKDAKQRAVVCFDSWRGRSKADVSAESFQWALPIIGMYDTKEGHWIKGVALSMGTSRNLTRYERNELAAGARTLKMKPLLVNHNKTKEVGFVHDAEFEDDHIEYIACVTNESYWKKIMDKEITHVSPLGQPRYWDRDDKDRLLVLQGKRAGAVKGIGFEELSLVEAPQLAGDLTTSIKIMETFCETCIEKTGEGVSFREPSAAGLATLETNILAIASANETVEDKEHSGEYWNGEKWVELPKDLAAFEVALLKTKVIKQLLTELKTAQKAQAPVGVVAPVRAASENLSVDALNNKLSIIALQSEFAESQKRPKRLVSINPNNLHISDFVRVRQRATEKRLKKIEERAKAKEGFNVNELHLETFGVKDVRTGKEPFLPRSLQGKKIERPEGKHLGIVTLDGRPVKPKKKIDVENMSLSEAMRKTK